MILCGIDESGRGPVIGNLVICGLLIDENKQEELTRIGVTDSKLLTPKKREQIAEKLIKKYKYYVIELTPAEVDEGLRKSNINWLEADNAIKIISELKPQKVIIDCPSPNTKAYTSYIKERLEDKSIMIHCAHHADKEHPPVGAASIIAKVLRDKRIDELKQKIGVDFGSGYMTDQRTVNFLEKNWNKYPELFRHTWTPYKKIIDKLKQGTLDEYKA